MTRNTLPLISCLCVSNDRPNFLKKVINYFQEQTYQHKELIIVSGKLIRDYEEITRSANSPSVKYYFLNNDRTSTLGELRNFSIKMSTGEYFCIWDDDDWYHQTRLEMQLQAAVKNNKSASVMPYFILFHAAKRQAFLSHLFPIPGSILCKKEIVSESLKYPSMNLSEDAHFLQTLVAKNVLFPIIDPSLYIYVFHGTNSWSEEHFNFFFSRGHKFSPSLSQLIEEVVNNKYNYQKASDLLRSPEVLKEFNYFHQRL